MSAASSQNSEPSPLTAVQAQVVLSLVRGATVTAAAQAAGLHRTTVYHWINTQPAFDAAINQARAEYILTLRDELKTMSSLALATLRSFLETNDTPPGVRLKAALAVLQRPDFPVPGWQLPEPTASSEEIPQDEKTFYTIRQNPSLFSICRKPAAVTPDSESA